MEIILKELAAHLAGIKGNPLPVYLAHGDEYLCKEAARVLVDALVPEDQRDFNLEEMDGGRVGASAVVSALFTFPMFAGIKAVVWTDSRVFISGATATDLLDRARQAHEDGEAFKAARLVLDFLTALRLEPGDLSPAEPLAALPDSVDRKADGPWISQALSLILEKGMTARSSDEAGIMLSALEKGAPGQNVLVITSPTADKRKKIYKHIKDTGLVVDCTVPGGQRFAEREARGRELSRIADQVLSPLGKTLEKAALQALEERIDADLRGFVSTLEKLAAFVGDRKRITASDVAKAVASRRTDPVYVFTGALFERKFEQSLSELASLLDGGYFPLQVLSAFANQVRKFLVARRFLESPHAAGWSMAMNFQEFKDRVMPGVDAFDKEARDLAADWVEEGFIVRAKGKKKKEDTDLVLSKGGSPYPVFLGLQTAGKFSQKELLHYLSLALAADRKLKSSAQDP
ncbi:MAG: DNA polymerase III subunit delta, partial [Pseudomonadota bacterium]